MFKVSSFSLLLVNALPVLGVLFLDWNIATIMILYWSENLVIGFFNIIKMARAEGRDSHAGHKKSNRPAQGRWFTIFFFIIHYGGFTLVHGIFVFVIFGPMESEPVSLLAAGICLFVSHFISLIKNFFKNQEYLRISFNRLFVQPYKRVIIMHLTILAAGFFIHSQEGPTPALLIMVGLKTVIDLISHRLEHKKFLRKRLPGQAPSSSH